MVSDPSTAAPAVDRPRTPVDRLRLMAVCFLLAGIAAFWSAGQAYYTMNLTDITVTTSSMRDVAGVSVDVSITGRDLAAQNTNAPTIGAGANMANTKTPGGFLGLPTAAALVLAAAAAGIAAALLCSVFAGLVAAGLAFFAFRSFSALTALVEDPHAGGTLVERAAGLQMLQYALVVVTVTAVSATVQTVMVAVARRRYKKALAEAEGRDPEPSLIDWIRGAAAAGTSAVATQARQSASERAQRASTSS